MRKVLIATPCYDGRVEGEYALALAETVRLGQQAGVHFQPLLIKREPIARCRNNLLAIFYYAPDYSDLLWIDADISWQPLHAIRLLQHQVDVVGGTYPRTEEPSTYVVKCDPEKLLVGANGLIEVEALGMGFLKMSRRAVNAVWEMGEPYQRHGREQRWVFDEHIEDADVVSEDVVACARLRAAGLPIFLDPHITCQHTAAKTWVADFWTALTEYHAKRKKPAAA